MTYEDLYEDTIAAYEELMQIQQDEQNDVLIDNITHYLSDVSSFLSENIGREEASRIKKAWYRRNKNDNN